MEAFSFKMLLYDIFISSQLFKKITHSLLALCGALKIAWVRGFLLSRETDGLLMLGTSAACPTATMWSASAMSPLTHHYYFRAVTLHLYPLPLQ